MTNAPKPLIARRIWTGAWLALPSLILLGGTAEAANWTARGNEPGWQVEMSDTAITFSTMEGETVTVEPVPEPVRGEGIEVYSATAGDKAFTLVVADKACADSMSGMPYPETVVVALDQRALIGCGGDPLSLLVGDWRVEEIAGQPVIAKSEATLAFDLDGSMHGNASCNRFFGGFTLTGEGLTLSPGGTTMMACEPEAMEQEQRFLASLETVIRFESPTDGHLRLFSAEGEAVLVLAQ